jgi:hypothetical protein
METVTLVPKYRKGKKPVRVRKPSRPIDGVNHRLIREQEEVREVVVDPVVEDAPKRKAGRPKKHAVNAEPTEE